MDRRGFLLGSLGSLAALPALAGPLHPGRLLIPRGSLGAGFNYVSFDGSTYLARGGDLTGNTDGKQGILSFHFTTTDNLTTQMFGRNTGSGVEYLLLNGSSIRIRAENAAGTIILDIRSTATGLTSNTRYHVAVSWDLGTPGARHVCINGIDDTNEVTFTDDTIDYTKANHSIGDNLAGATIFTGCLAQFYANYDEYIDLSVPANLAKFYNSGPVDLGADGSLPTGNSPIVFLPNAAATFGTNAGTGGNFTVSAGALTVCA